MDGNGHEVPPEGRASATARALQPSAVAAPGGGPSGGRADKRTKSLWVLMVLTVVFVCVGGVLLSWGQLTTAKATVLLVVAPLAAVFSLVLLVNVLVELFRRRLDVSVMVGAAISTCALAVIAYAAIPDPHLSATVATVLWVLAVVVAVSMIVTLVSNLRRRALRPAVVVGTAFVVLLDVSVSLGLNAYAASSLTSASAFVQNDYAGIAAAVTLGWRLQRGTAPAGTGYGTIVGPAQASVAALDQLHVPAALVAYRDAVRTWGATVAMEGRAAERGHPWNAPYWPLRATVDLTATEVQRESVIAFGRVGVIVEYGNFDMASRDFTAMTFVGARLESQTYWLDDVLSSPGRTGVGGELQFSAWHRPAGVVVHTTSGIELTAYAGPVVTNPTCPPTKQCFNPPRGPFTQTAGSIQRLQALQQAAVSVGAFCGDAAPSTQGGPCYTAAKLYDVAQNGLDSSWDTSGVFPQQVGTSLRSCGSYIEGIEDIQGAQAGAGGSCRAELTPAPIEALQTQCTIQLEKLPPKNQGVFGESGWGCANPSPCQQIFQQSGVVSSCQDQPVLADPLAAAAAQASGSGIGSATSPPTVTPPTATTPTVTPPTATTPTVTTPPGTSPPATTTSPQYPFDGTYSGTESGSVDGQPFSRPVSFTVVHDTLSTGTTIPPSGTVPYSVDIPVEGGEVTATSEMHFSVSGGVARVTGTFNAVGHSETPTTTGNISTTVTVSLTLDASD